MSKNQSPTVSVAIPTFNRANLIGNAIESVLNQTYTDYEIIVVDDGSTDETTEKLKPYRGRIRYFRQENRGASAAQNKCIELARGEWLSILASDDLWLPTKLERQINVLNELGPAYGACFTDCSFFGSPKWNLTAFEQAGLPSRPETGPCHAPLKHMLAKYALIYVQSLLVRRSLVEDIGGFDERLTVAEDQDLLFRLAFKTKYCFVAMPLVRIDRTESRTGGLTELLAHNDERALFSLERCYRKWMGLPELVDPVIHRQIQMDLRALYDSWIITKLYQFKFTEALEKVRQQRRNDSSYAGILGRLAFRASRRLCSTLRG